MSEPRNAAKTVDEMAPGLFHYRIQDDRIHHASEGFALVEGGKAVLIDPLPIEEAALERLGAIEAIVIGSASHQRSAWRYRTISRARVYAPLGAKGLDERADVDYREGDRLPGGLRPILARGPRAPHFALHLDRGPGVLFCTDLLMHEPDRGLVLLPDKYMDEPARGPESARALLDLEFDALCFGHGLPITKGGRRALDEALARHKGSQGPVRAA